MTTRRRTVRKVSKPEPQQEKLVAKVVRIQVTVEVSVSSNDRRTFEEFRDSAITALKDPDGEVRAKNATPLGGYYIIEGKACMPDDFDTETWDRKPGTHPPLWALSHDEQEIIKRIEREKRNPNTLARNPQGLRTAAETDRHHQISRTPAEALKDLRENTEWGKRKQAEFEQSMNGSTPSDDDDDDYGFEDEQIVEAVDEETEEDWSEDDVWDDDSHEEAVSTGVSSAVSKLRAAKKTAQKKPARGRTTTRRARRKS